MGYTTAGRRTDDGETFVAQSWRAMASGSCQMPGYFIYGRVRRLDYIGRSNKKMESLLLAMRLQIGHLGSFEDSERSRAACVNYLQGWLPNFYPDRPDIVKQLEQLELWRPLETPRFSWKYTWTQEMFGLAAAKQAQLTYNETKSFALDLRQDDVFS